MVILLILLTFVCIIWLCCCGSNEKKQTKTKTKSKTNIIKSNSGKKDSSYNYSINRMNGKKGRHSKQTITIQNRRNRSENKYNNQNVVPSPATQHHPLKIKMSNSAPVLIQKQEPVAQLPNQIPEVHGFQIEEAPHNRTYSPMRQIINEKFRVQQSKAPKISIGPLSPIGSNSILYKHRTPPVWFSKMAAGGKGVGMVPYNKQKAAMMVMAQKQQQQPQPSLLPLNTMQHAKDNEFLTSFYGKV